MSLLAEGRFFFISPDCASLIPFMPLWATQCLQESFGKSLRSTSNSDMSHMHRVQHVDQYQLQKPSHCERRCLPPWKCCLLSIL